MYLHEEDREDYERGQEEAAHDCEKVLRVYWRVVSQMRFDFDHIFATIKRNVEATVSVHYY